MSDYFLGEIRLFAGNYAPLNFVPCDGRLLNVADNQALFSLLGVTWGGDGQNTFAVPDLRGRLPVGQGANPKLTARTLGQRGGSETVTLGLTNLPGHTHPWNTQASQASSTAPTGNLLARLASPDVGYVTAANKVSAFTFSPTMVENTGGNEPHKNLMPSLGLSYIICTFGLYPTRP